MPNRKDWQPEDTQVETAAMALRAQQMRLWNLVEDSATVGRCWQQTPVWLRCEYRQMASAMLRAVHSHSPDSIRDKRPPSVRQLSEKAAVDILPRMNAGDSRILRFGFLFATTKQERRGR